MKTTAEYMEQIKAYYPEAHITERRFGYRVCLEHGDEGMTLAGTRLSAARKAYAMLVDFGDIPAVGEGGAA